MKRLDAWKIVVRTFRKEFFRIRALECQLSDCVRNILQFEIKAFRESLKMAKIFLQIRGVDDE